MVESEIIQKHMISLRLASDEQCANTTVVLLPKPFEYVKTLAVKGECNREDPRSGQTAPPGENTILLARVCLG